MLEINYLMTELSVLITGSFLMEILSEEMEYLSFLYKTNSLLLA